MQYCQARLGLFFVALCVSHGAFAVERNAQGEVISAESASLQRAQVERAIEATRVRGLYAESMWITRYDWLCFGTPVPSLTTVYPDHTFMDKYGSSGTWTLDERDVVMTYPNGTVYTGVLSPNNQRVKGTMVSFDGTTGCFTAHRL